MRAMLFGAIVLLAACGSTVDSESPPVIIDDGPSSNTSSNSTANASSSNAPGNVTPNNEANNNVTTSHSLEKSGSRYKAKVLQSREGAQTFVGWYDTELEVDCGIASSDGKCIPHYEVFIGLEGGNSIDGTVVRAVYSDAECTNFVGISTDGSGCLDVREGDYVGITGDRSTNCRGQQVSRVEDYARVGAPYDGPAYRRGSSECTPDDGVERFELGELIPRTAIPGWTEALID